MLLDPIHELRNACVHSGLARLGAISAEANYTLQPPSVVGLTDQWTPGVATA